MMSQMKGQIEVFPGNGRIIRGWFWRERAANGETISVSESYTTKWSCKRTARKIAASKGIPLVEKPYARIS
jgi:uncharacterized protein YegP (UPF0339 family)